MKSYQGTTIHQSFQPALFTQLQWFRPNLVVWVLEESTQCRTAKLLCKHLHTQTALAAVAHWIECQPVNERVAGSIPTQGTCLGCRPGYR